MTKHQTVFGDKGLDVLDMGLTREDRVLKQQMESKKVLCSYCLQYGTLWDFHTRLKNKRGKHFISISKCKCPCCHQGFMKKTLLKIANMSMEEFAEWFWSQMFEGWGFGDKVDFLTFKDRLKKHFRYETRQIFWDIYWEYKDASVGGADVKQTREDFEDYKRQYEKENQTP